jgi:hypothetical protein
MLRGYTKPFTLNVTELQQVESQNKPGGITHFPTKSPDSFPLLDSLNLGF